MDNHCVVCGAYLADTGRMICEKCEKPKKAKLKPCPFCGGKARLIYSMPFNAVHCTKCKVFGKTIVDSYEQRDGKAEAIKAWNRRCADEC